MDPIPIAVKFDCAMELANGTILGYREEGQVDIGKMYANVVFLLLLRHEHMTKNVTEAKELKRCAVITLDRIKSICVCLMKQCDSHVYRAMRDQRKNMNKPPMEMRIYKDQIDRINLHLASSLKNLPRIVDVIARLSVMIAIYELQTLPCECFDLNSTTNEHHDSALSESIAQTMHRILEEEIGAMMLDNDDQLDALVQE